MKRLNSKEVKYLGEGIVGVYESGKLTERFQLEKGDNLLEAFGGRGLTEGARFDKYLSVPMKSRQSTYQLGKFPAKAGGYIQVAENANASGVIAWYMDKEGRMPWFFRIVERTTQGALNTCEEIANSSDPYETMKKLADIYGVNPYWVEGTDEFDYDRDVD